MKKNLPKCEIDIKELLKQELLKQSNDDTHEQSPRQQIQQIQQIQQVPRPREKPVGFEDFEFHLDSLDKDPSSLLSVGEIKWSLNSLQMQDVKNIVQVKIGEFFFPKIDLPEEKPNFFFYRRVYLQILNLPSTQSIIAANGNQYHFEFEVDYLSSIAVKLTPLKDVFCFQKPILSMSDIQFRFMVPHGFKKIPIPSDTAMIISVPNSSPARFVMLNDTTAIIGKLGAQTAPGVAVFISNYITPYQLINDQVNSQYGLYITNIIDNKTFEINSVGLSGVDAVEAAMIIPKNRISTTIRLTSMRDYVTNNIPVGRT